MRELGLKIDPAKAPKLNLFGWNIGARQLSTAVETNSTLPIVEITSVENMKALADIYFKKVDPCYGFIDRRLFLERLDARWKSPMDPDVYDSVLSGVAALGCLFSQRNCTVTELHLVSLARSRLDEYILSGAPSVDLVTAWVLRAIYLRLTSSPHSTWIASSTLMHFIEASGIHLESSRDILLPQSNAQCDPDIRRRIVGVAHHLNIWTSFDLGLSRVSLQNGLPLLPSTRRGDYTTELLHLLPVSASLDPGRSQDETHLKSTLSEILDGTHTQPPSVMAQCNLALCILRRLHTQNLDISQVLHERILGLLKKGLCCARSLVMDCSPWHQAANVPFQIICVLLVMDTRSSLAMLPEAAQTLKLIASTYDTETMREAYSTACLLIMLHQQRRKDDITIFNEALHMYQDERQVEPSPPQASPSAEEYTWLGALVADLPGLQRVDLDQFLNLDMINQAPLVSD